ncbi:MAG: hypothetical protein ACK5BN_08480 [Planctomycetota bacterium]
MNCTPHSVLALALAAAATAQSPITPGNLIVSRIGDGAAALTSAATARFLDEYTPAGVLVQTIALPTAVAGANRRLTDSGTATSNGFVTQSADGRFLVAAGYDAAPGTAAVTGSASATVQRVIARIGLDGVVDTSTALGDAYTGNNFRGACSVDGGQFWTSGTGTTPTPGVRYVAALGATTSVQLSTTVTNIRCVDLALGQLYCSSASGAFQGVSAVGAGLPTTSGQTITLLPGFPTATGPSSYAFCFADANTLYVADDRATAAGGIQKWALAGGTWTLAYTLSPGTNVGCRGLSGTVDNGVVTLYATTTAALAQVVRVVDGGATSAFTTLLTAATNTALRDVQFVRTPSGRVASGTACANGNGTPAIGANGLPVTGNAAFAFTGANLGAGSFALFVLSGLPPFGAGVPIPGAPACALLFVAPDNLLGAVADAAGAAVQPVPIPAAQALVGVQLAAQVAAFDLGLVPAFAVPVGTSGALQVTVGN